MIFFAGNFIYFYLLCAKNVQFRNIYIFLTSRCYKNRGYVDFDFDFIYYYKHTNQTHDKINYQRCYILVLSSLISFLL